MEKELVLNTLIDEKKRERSAKFLIWAGFFLYILMMGSKNVYTAEIAAIQLAFSKTKAEASLAMTYYFITYAVGQVVIAPLFSKINIKIFLTISAGLSSLVTVLLGVMPSMGLLYLLCAINGVLQSGIYSGVMAIIGKYSPANLLPYATKVMSAGGAICGVISYGVPAIFVGYGLWNVPFILLGIIFAFTVLVFFVSAQIMGKYPPEVKEKKDKNDSCTEPMYIDVGSTKKKVSYFVIMAIVSLFGNLMYYLLMQWIPSLLNEQFGMHLSYSILITLLVPIAIFLASLWAISQCEKYRNIFTVSLIITLVSLGLFLPMLFFYNVNIIFTIVCMVGYIAVSTAGRVATGSIIAFKMRSHINTGSYLALMNAFAAVIAGIAPPIAGEIIDSVGYGKLFGLIFIIGIVFVGLLLVCVKMVEKQHAKNLETQPNA